MKEKAHFWGWVLLFVSFVWGIEFSLVHQALDSMGPNTFNSLRFSIAVLTLVVYFRFSGFRFFKSLNASVIHHGVILGVMLFTGFSTQTIGLQYTSASNAGFITGLNVVLVPVIAWAWLKQPQQWFVWLGVAMATLGTVLLTGGLDGIAPGELWVLVCAFMFAIHIVYTGVYVAEVDPLALTQVQLITVTVLSLAAAGTFEAESLLSLPQVLITDATSNSGVIVWTAILVGGTLGTGLAFVAQTIGQQSLAAWRVALIFATEPLFAALGGYWLLGETLTLYAWFGAALILGGMLVAELVEGRETETIASAPNP